MARGIVWVLFVLGVAAPALLAGEPDAKATRVARVRATLDKIVSTPEFGPSTTLQSALEYFTDRYDLTFIISASAFKADLSIMEPQWQPVKLEAMRKVPLRTVLELLLAQGSGAFFVDRDGSIAVVPADTVMTYQLRQRVRATFDKKPLNDALKELAADTGVTVLLDKRRAGDKAKSEVSAELKNVTLEVAVTLLADLVELKVVQMDRVLYVTTVENARTIRIEQERKQREEKKNQNPNENAK
jgi:hypothetical protein